MENRPPQWSAKEKGYKTEKAGKITDAQNYGVVSPQYRVMNHLPSK